MIVRHVDDADGAQFVKARWEGLEFVVRRVEVGEQLEVVERLRQRRQLIVVESQVDQPVGDVAEFVRKLPEVVVPEVERVQIPHAADFRWDR